MNNSETPIRSGDATFLSKIFQFLQMKALSPVPMNSLKGCLEMKII